MEEEEDKNVNSSFWKAKFGEEKIPRMGQSRSSSLSQALASSFPWRFSFHYHRSEPKEPPKEFLCPISGSLMADPVVVSSGQTFERVSVQVCRNLEFFPKLGDGLKPDFSALIPNLAMKLTILHWCENSGAEPPRIADYNSVERIVRKLIEEEEKESRIRVSERELLNGVADKPPVLFPHAASEKNHRVNYFNSSSSEESVIVEASPGTSLHFTNRPSCYSTASSSSEIFENEVLNLNRHPDSSTSEEEELVSKLRSSEIYEQEEGVISLRQITKNREEIRVSLCTPQLLSALRSLISSRYSTVQTNAIASVVNLSLEKENKAKIVRSGLAPPLIDALKGGYSESQEHAAGALFSLALEHENQMAIGVLGAIPPLLHSLRSERELTRRDSALCLYHLTQVQSNRDKLVKLGAVPTLLSMAKSRNLTSAVLMVLCNLAVTPEGRDLMLDSDAVGILVEMLREKTNSKSIHENCVAALYALSRGSMRFRVEANAAKAAEALREVEERGSERARAMATKVLQIMKGRAAANEHILDVVDSLNSGGLSWTRHRAAAGKTPLSPKSNAF